MIQEQFHFVSRFIHVKPCHYRKHRNGMKMDDKIKLTEREACNYGGMENVSRTVVFYFLCGRTEETRVLLV